MASNDQELVQLTRDGDTATLKLNRAKSRNAINQSMWEDISEKLDVITADTSIRVLVVTGHGGSFSAGADIVEFEQLCRSPKDLRYNNELLQATQEKLEALPRPTIAMIEGNCFGAGLGLALSCDLRMASADAAFSIPPAKLGIVYSMRDTKRLLALVGPAVTKEMLFTGKRLSTEQALSVGLVNHLCTPEQLKIETYELAEQIAQNSQFSTRNIKRVIAALQNIDDLDNDAAEQLFNDAFLSEDAQEGIAAFREKRRPQFTWS